MKEYDAIISLGHNCSPVYQLSRLGLRKKAYPFDWLCTDDIGSIQNLIDKRFEGIWGSIIKGGVFKATNMEAVTDTTYKITTLHDFKPGGTNKEEVIQKYERRSKRFFETLEKDIAILFIRYDWWSYAVQYLNLIASIKKIRGDKPFDIWIIGTCVDSHLLPENTVLYQYEGTADWQGSDKLWDTVMANVRIKNET